MAAGSASRVIRAPGRLVVAPTALGVPDVYGGTEIGLTRACVLQPLGSPFRVECEGTGDASDVLNRPLRFVFSCFLRGWDNDAIAKVFPDLLSVGAVTGHAIYTAPGDSLPGTSALDRGHVFLYVPDDTINVPAILIYRGIPDWSGGAAMAFQRQDELGIPLAIECVRNDDGKTLAVGRLADLSLT